MRANEEEGFYVDQPILENISVSINTSSRPTDYEPRYLIANKLLKREPPEVISTPPSCEILYSSQQTKRRSSIKKQQPLTEPETLASHYLNKQIYDHVYCRSGCESPTSQQGESLAANILALNHLNEYSSLDYSVLKPYTFPETSKTGFLQFDSRFQGGNLAHAFLHKDTREYHLIIQNDLNTNGYNQWFYFSVSGMRKGVSYVFNIVNYRKSTSLFEEGMLPAIFSFEKNKWFRAGRNISYTRSNKVDSESFKERLYRLSFSLSGEERLMVAAGMPYSYTKMIKALRLMEEKAQSNNLINFTLATSGYTIGNNAVPMVTIESSESTSKKKTIVITSRQHSGEVWSSYLCQQLMWELINNPRSLQILHKYTFKIFPMINVDGVIYGNFRCDMGGVDLNRRWKEPCKYLQPHTFSIKEYLTTLHEKNPIEMYFDLHGHSKKFGCFCYCCNLNDDARILPFTLSELTPLVSFQDCTFGLEKCKSKTARGFMFQLCQKINILTVECSTFGYKQNQKNHHFEPKDMKTLAESTLLAIWVNMKEQNQYRSVTISSVKQKINQRKEEFKEHDRGNESESGSDSDPEGGEMDENEKMLKVLPKRILKLIKNQEEERDASVAKKRKKTKKNRSVAKSNPRLSLYEKRESVFTTPPVEDKHQAPLVKRQPQRIREKSLSYHKQFEPVQQRFAPLKSTVISKTPMSFRPTPLVKIVHQIPTKSRITKRISKQVLFPQPIPPQTKKTVQMPMIRRKTLPSQSQCQQSKQAKSNALKREQKIAQVRVFNQRYLKAEAKQKGLCLISETKELEHMIRIQNSRRDSCIVNPSYSTKKKEPIINYDSYKNRDKNRSSLLNEVSKLWKFHVEKYTKELEYNII